MASFIGKLVAGALPLFGGLSPGNTNGGLVNYQGRPDFLGSSAPWGSVTYDGDTVNQKTPETGVTRYYDFNIARAKLSPDGYQRDMIVVNGQYPGPLIEANWGDWIEVTVTNNITNPEEGTAIHWHALLQKDTPYYDGVPGISQCPIAPGESFTYRFRADHVGTTFYHSHYSAQVNAGVSGPIVFHGPKSQNWDYDVGPVLISDWFHKEYFEIVKGVMGSGADRIAATSVNNLINGKMNFDCSTVTDGTPCVSNAGVSKFTLKPGKDNLLRIINGGSAGLQYFSVDDHLMTVVAMDFIPIKPYTTNVITLGVGQRTDVIIHGKTGNLTNQAYWIRSNISTTCALPDQPYGLAALYYSDADSDANKVPTSQPQDYDVTRFGCGNEPLTLTQPLTPMPVKEPDTTVTINVIDTLNATGNDEYLLNNRTFHANYNLPVLKAVIEGTGSNTTTFDPLWNVLPTGDSKVFRIVWENQKFDPADPNLYALTFAHPMHLHGHDYQVLSAGPGPWDGSLDADASNALRRDTHILPPNGHLVVQFETDNPGVWPFHCHVAWHVSAGFDVNILERAQDLVNLPNTAEVMNQTCTAWDAWSATNVVDQIDSGLRMAMERS
ncbi:putative multicopper oxidase [Hypoxylon rubiginosum]|uniref:Multicopper oxidase n=1 Tax=Hypoxylon rubiginosum TaxID=110542 RepID=A0ACB9YTT6_9PEZI|nr:putative multicopper oxidase [Hypoxylon rubiginosum]